jgi:predicted DNA-binding transcriptional regulator YafY
MTNKEQVERIIALHYLLSNRRFPTMSDFQHYYSLKDWKNSPRTVNRDLEFLKTNLGLVITFDRTYKGYKIEESNKLKIEELLNLLRTNHSISHILKEAFFSTSRRWLFNHQEYLTILFQAIEFKQKILVSYKTHDRTQIKTYILHPYHLREAAGRLYLTAQPDDENKVIATYALERISKLEVLKEHYEMKKSFDAFDHFKYCLGIWRLNDESRNLIPAKNIVLELDTEAFNYIRDYPIHFSQEIITELENGRVQFRITVQDNPDLYNTLLQLQRTLKVISPAEVKNQFLNILRSIISLNQDD